MKSKRPFIQCNSLLFAALMLLLLGTFSCKSDADPKDLYKNCFLFREARASLKIDKDTTLYFPIQSLSSIDRRTTTLSLDTATIGLEGVNFGTPRSYSFEAGETEGSVAISLKHINSDSLVRIVLNLQTENCIGYVENGSGSQSYKSIQIDYRSVQ